MERIENEMETVEREETNYEEAETTNEGSGLGTGAAMIIGSGLTIAIVAIVKGVKKLVTKHKAKKEQANVIDIPQEDYKEVNDSEK